MPKVYIKTFGCQMNRRDSEALLGLLQEEGYFLASSLQGADIVLVNTCSVRQHAENRALSFTASLKNKVKILGIIGCMAKARGEEIAQKMPYVDIICSPAKMAEIPRFLKEAGEGKKTLALEDGTRPEEFYHSSFRFEKDRAQVVISTGCSNYCTYCIVPYVRGPLRLRRPQDIISEVKKNIDLGIRRITLLGQNVNDYQYKLSAGDGSALGGQIIDFVELLRMIEKIEGIEEINFVTSHPKNTSRELFELMASSQKIKKHLHLPFQSGSDRILKLMNRGYTKQDYLKLIDDYYCIVGGTLSTDVIVGFPTETKKDFLETKKILEKVHFRYAYIFKYSPRPYTKAFSLKDDVPKEIKEKRHRELLDLQKRISTGKV